MSSNDLEKLLKLGDYEDRKDRIVIQEQNLTNPRDPSRIGLPNSAKFAQGNAQVKDFFEMVVAILESVLEDYDVEVIPWEKAYLKKEDPDQKLKNYVVTYRVKDRRHKPNTAYKPKLDDTFLDDTGDRTISRWTEYFVTQVQFSILGMQYDVAWEIMDILEETLIYYSSYIKQQGIREFYFVNQDQDDYVQDFREIGTVFTLNYCIETEKNRVISKQKLKGINVHGEAYNNESDDKGNPLT